jgi:alpha-L-rhamnosidase
MQGRILRKLTLTLLTAIVFSSLLFSHLSFVKAATPDWSIQNGALQTQGGNVGLLAFGSNWTDYTMTFSTQIVSNQSGWVVRGQAADKNYLFILDAHNDIYGTRDALQEVVEAGANTYDHIATVALSSALRGNTWHAIKTVVKGTTITIFLDGTQISSLDSTSFASGVPSYATGTVGFRSFTGEAADFKNLQITDVNGSTLYANPLSQSSNLNDFFVPGSSTSPNPWPSNPNWQQYVQAPTSRDIYPTAVASTAGNVSNAAGLIHPGSGQTTTLTWSGSGTAPSIVLDYGKDTGGLPQFTVTAETGSPTLLATYSEGLQYLSSCGDCADPYQSTIADPQRYDTYSVSQAGTIVNRYIQGGERYQGISLTTAGSITLSAVEIYYEAYQGTASTFQGNFISDQPLLNRIWYDGAYTVNLNQLPAHTSSGAWSIQQGVLDIQGGNAALLNSGSSWTDYTMSFSTEVNTNQAGWVVRGQSSNSDYLLILNADNDTGGTPNALQEVVDNNGTYILLATVALPFDIKPATWHTVKTVVQGTTVTTSIDGQQIASFNSTQFPASTPTYSSGTIGFREYGSEEASFKNLLVVDASNNTLYQNALSQPSALNDFAAPGNPLPIILDGAKRDRDVWEGDLNISGPTLYYSSNATEYMKGSLQLLGSYQYTSGFVQGVQSALNQLNTAPLAGTVGPYSASYSIYFVLNMADYYLYTGDLAFVKQEWPIVQNELAWSAQQVNSQGLFVTNSSDGNDWHYYDGSLNGTVTEFNLLYYQSLIQGATLASAVGNSSQAETYLQQAAALKTAINQNLFNTATGLYKVSDTNSAVAQDANAMAVLYGVAPASAVAGILSGTKEDLWTSAGPLPFSSDANFKEYISPFISAYDVWSRMQSNDTANALSLITTEWGEMVNSSQDGTSTDWENIASNGTPVSSYTSMAHGWSTGATSALSKYVLGISPVSPGYQTWLVQPHPGSVAWCEGQAPTAYGTLSTQWGYDANKQFHLQVQAPAGTTGTIAVPVTNSQQVQISVNGNVVWNNGTFQATSGVTGASASSAYVNLSVSGGTTYLVTANP